MLATIRRHWFLILLAVYVLYALAFVYRSSVVAGGQRYFVLMDDAMISMTYARNLARGTGRCGIRARSPCRATPTRCGCFTWRPCIACPCRRH